MSEIIISLKSEFYKSKRSIIFFSSILFPVLIVGLYVYGIVTQTKNNLSSNVSEYEIATYQWLQYIGNLGSSLSTFLIPMYTIFIAYSVNDMEHKADMWKTVFSLPIKKEFIYAGKYLYAISLLLITMMSFYILSSISLHIISGIAPNYFHYNNYKYGDKNLMMYLLKFFLSSLGILSLQMTLSFLWKDFMKPMGIGLLGVIIGFVWALKKTETAYLFPYAQPIRAGYFKVVRTIKNGEDVFTNFHIFSLEIVLSLVYLVVFSLIGFYIVSKKSIQ